MNKPSIFFKTLLWVLYNYILSSKTMMFDCREKRKNRTRWKNVHNIWPSAPACRPFKKRRLKQLR